MLKVETLSEHYKTNFNHVDCLDKPFPWAKPIAILRAIQMNRSLGPKPTAIP